MIVYNSYCTVVNFRATYEDGIDIDSIISTPWDTQRNAFNLMQMVDEEEAKQHIYDSMCEDQRRVSNEMTRAYQHMQMRKNFNNTVRGPFVFHSEEPLSEFFLIQWAKENVFKQLKEN